jgi:hypothetical protein
MGFGWLIGKWVDLCWQMLFVFNPSSQMAVLHL